MSRTICLALSAVLGTVLSGLLPAESAETRRPKRAPDSVYVPTPGDVVAKMLEVAAVTKDDIVYDPGCGDGRMVVMAAKKFGCRGVGIELSPKLVQEARANAQRNSVEKLVRIREDDIYAVDLSEATVVTLYLLPEMNVKLIKQLQKLKPGARIVAHDYRFTDRSGEERVGEPDKTLTMTSKEDAVEHYIYLWKAPLPVQPATR